MTEQINPGALKTLASILALVVEDQPGQPAAALEAARRRARHDGLTGATLKELVLRVGNAAPPPRPAPGGPQQSRPAPNGAQAKPAPKAAGNSFTRQAQRVAELEHQLADARAQIIALARRHADLSAAQRQPNHRAFGAALAGMAVAMLLLGAAAGWAASSRPAPHAALSAAAAPSAEEAGLRAAMQHLRDQLAAATPTPTVAASPADAPAEPAPSNSPPPLRAATAVSRPSPLHDPALVVAMEEHARACWSALDREIADAPLRLVAELDTNGVAQATRVADEDAWRLRDPRFRAYAGRVVQAVLDPRCAALPASDAMRGDAPRTVEFSFWP